MLTNFKSNGEHSEVWQLRLFNKWKLKLPDCRGVHLIFICYNLMADTEEKEKKIDKLK